MHQLFVLLANSPFFASRAFLAPFILIICYRFPEYIPFYDVSFDVSADTSWLFTDASLYTFGILAIIEILATKNEESAELYDEYMGKAKVVLAMVVNSSLLSPEAAAVLNHVRTAGFSLMQTLAFLSAVVVNYVGEIRRNIYEFLRDIDDDDDLKLRVTLSFLEDFAVIIGVVLTVVVPILVLVITGIVLLIFYVRQRHLSKIEESTKVPCPNCDVKILPAATECYFCHSVISHPMAVGFLGQMTETPSKDPQEQKRLLLTARRCPHCASEIAKGRVVQKCGVCGFEPKEPQFQELLTVQKKRLPIALLLLTLVGLIPVIGMVVAILYIKMVFVKPFKQYLPNGKSRLGRFAIRLLTLFCMMLQSIPFAGALIPPILLLVNMTVWKRLFSEELEKRF